MKPTDFNSEHALRARDIRTGKFSSRPANHAFLAWIASGVLLAGVLGFLSSWKKPAVLPEVLSSELTTRDGRLYWGNQSQPFTGWMLEMFREDGGVKSRSMIRGGVLDGLSQGWYSTGQIQVREFFKNGVSHGLRTKWFEDGTKSSEGLIVEGKHDGSFLTWHENGFLAERIEMKDDKPHGVSRAWAPDGRLIALVYMENGEVVRRESIEPEEDRQDNIGKPLVQK